MVKVKNSFFDELVATKALSTLLASTELLAGTALDLQEVAQAVENRATPYMDAKNALAEGLCDRDEDGRAIKIIRDPDGKELGRSFLPPGQFEINTHRDEFLEKVNALGEIEVEIEGCDGPYVIMLEDLPDKLLSTLMMRTLKPIVLIKRG